MPDPQPLEDLLNRLPFDQMRRFVEPRIPRLDWHLAQATLARMAAAELVHQDPWMALTSTFPGRSHEINSTRARCGLPPPASPAPITPNQTFNIGAIHGANVAIGNTGSVTQHAALYASPQELGFQLARSGPLNELVRALNEAEDPRTALSAALAECDDPTVRPGLESLAARYDVQTRWDVFLAYATPDRTEADTLAGAIAARGPTVFLDHKCIPAGVLWGAALQRALSGARVVVFLVAENLWERPYLAHEVTFAIEQARKGTARLIPVWKAAPGTPPYGLQAFQTLTLTAGMDAVAQQIAEAVLGAATR